LILVADDGHGKNGDHHAVVWGEPILRGPAGELSLTELEWLHATSRWGSVSKNCSAAGHALWLGGRPLDHGLSVHTKSVIVFEVPEGYDRFVAECGFEGQKLPRKAEDHSRCLVFHQPVLDEAAAAAAPRAGLPISVLAREIGFDAPILVRDLWSGEDLGTFDEVFTRVIPWHGAGLFRVAPRRAKR
jgi:alpha-galactosidase